MLRLTPYDREAAVEYARTWAFRRNPAYYDFENLGGDCTNFASQCLYAGSGVMNYTPTFGWYYKNSSNRSASWTGVIYLYQFLIQNTGPGPFATETGPHQMKPGDIIQLGDQTGRFYHSPVVVAVSPEEIYVAAHTFDAFHRPLSSYVFDRARYLHIEGVRKYQ